MSIPYRPSWPLLVALLLGTGVVLALTYLPEEHAGQTLPARGGTYVEGVAGAPSRINPLFASFNEVDRDLSSLVFSSLVRLGPKGDIQPELAERWTITPNGRSYVFQLRRGLVWHDGQPLVAEDVAFTIRTIQDPEFQGDPALGSVFRGVTVEAQDAHTVVITLAEPFAPFLALGATVGILPQHLLAGLGGGVLFESPFNQHPVGSGPFRLAELTSERAVLRPFEAYALGDPFLEQIDLRFYRDNAGLLNALLGDEVEGALLQPSLTPEELASVSNDSRFVHRSLHTPTYNLIYLNPALPALRTAAVRRALQLGLDRTALITDVLAGQALPVDSPIVRDLWASEPAPDAYAYEPARAGELLDQAGWPLVDGKRVKNERTLHIRLVSSDDPVQSNVAEAVAAQWRALGIEVDVQVSGASQFIEEVLLPRRFSAALVSIDPGADPDPYPFWHSSQALGNGRNLSSFSQPEADRLLENARQTPSETERAADYRAFQQLFAREQPAVLLYTSTYQYVYRSDLQEVKPGLLFTPSARFYNVHRWYTETGGTIDAGT